MFFFLIGGMIVVTGIVIGVIVSSLVGGNASNQTCCSTTETCEDDEIRTAVCVGDFATCCTTTNGWNETCVTQAIILGLQTCSDTPCCQVNNAAVGCSNITVQDSVCAHDITCCTVAWATECVTLAHSLEGLESCSNSSCCSVSASGGCENATIQEAVCDIRPECCTEASGWSYSCVGQALTLGLQTCSVTPCCEVNTTQAGCANATVQAAVCTEDVLCCTNPWDESCIQIGASLGVLDCNTDCCTSNPNQQGCSNATIQSIVCAQQPECCTTTGWTSQCVATVITLGLQACAIHQPCCSSISAFPLGPIINGGQTGGCESTVLTAAVCGVMPTCCTVAWSEPCVELMLSSFAPLTLSVYGGPVGTQFCSGQPCCMAGFPRLPTGAAPYGCNQVTTQSIVCNTPGLSGCCFTNASTTGWNATCAQAALQLAVNTSTTSYCDGVLGISCCSPNPYGSCDNPAAIVGVCGNVSNFGCCDSQQGGWATSCIQIAVNDDLLTCGARAHVSKKQQLHKSHP